MDDKKLVHAVADLVKERAYIFTCSYKTAWEQWVTNEEKHGFTCEQVKLYW